MTKNQLTIQLKRLGKKKIKSVHYHIDIIPSNLQQLIETFIRAEVQRYNDRINDDQIISFLTTEQITKQQASGKIDFKAMNNRTQALEKEALASAIQGYQDGLFVVFIDDLEITDLNQAITLTEQSTITFIRMTFLTGTHW